MPQALAEGLLSDVVELAFIHHVEGLAQHVIDNALLSLLLHDFDLGTSQALLIKLISFLLLHDIGVFLRTTLVHTHAFGIFQ